MTTYNYYKICRTCGGDGLFPNNSMSYEGEVLPPENPRPCEACGGTGKEAIGFVDLAEIENKLDAILAKCEEIFDNLPGQGHGGS